MEAVVPPLLTDAPGTPEHTQQLAKAFVASLAIGGKMPQVVLLDSDGTFVFHTVYDKYVDAQFFANGYAGGGTVVAADIKPEQLKSLFIDPNFLIAVLQEFAEKNITPVILSKQSVHALEGIYGSLEYSPGMTVAQHINQRGAIVGPGYKNVGKSLKVRVGEVDIDVPVPVYSNKPAFTKALLEHKVNGVDQDIVVALLDDAEGKSVKDKLTVGFGRSAKVANFKGVGGEGVFIDHGERIREKINEQEVERECAEVAFPNDDGAVDAFLVQPVSEKRENSVFMEAMRKAYAEVNVAIMREHGIGLRAAAERLVWPERARDPADVDYLEGLTRRSFDVMGSAAQVAAVQASNLPLHPTPPAPKTVEDYVQEIAVCAIEEESLARLEAAIALNDAKFVGKISAPARQDGASLLQMSISAGYYKLASKLIEVGADKGQLFGKGQLNIAEILIIKMQGDKKAEDANPSVGGAYQAKYQEACALLKTIAEEAIIDKALQLALTSSVKNKDSDFFIGLLKVAHPEYTDSVAIDKALVLLRDSKTIAAAQKKDFEKDLNAKLVAAKNIELVALLQGDLDEALDKIKAMPNGGPLHEALAIADVARFEVVLKILKDGIADVAKRKEVLGIAYSKKAGVAGSTALEVLIDAKKMSEQPVKKYDQAKLLVDDGATVSEATLERILAVESGLEHGSNRERAANALIDSIFTQLDEEIDGRVIIAAPNTPDHSAQQAAADAEKAALRDRFLIKVATASAESRKPTILQGFLAKEGRVYSAEAVQEAQQAISKKVKTKAWKALSDTLTGYIAPEPAAVVAVVDPLPLPPLQVQGGDDQDAAPLPKTFESLMGEIEQGLSQEWSADKEQALVTLFLEAKDLNQAPQEQQDDDELDEEPHVSFAEKIKQPRQVLGNKTILQASIEHGFFNLASKAIESGAVVAQEDFRVLITKMKNDKGGHQESLVSPESGFFAAMFRGKKRDGVLAANAEKEKAYLVKYQSACGLLENILGKLDKVVADEALSLALEWAATNKDSAFFAGLLAAEGVSYSNSAAIAKAKVEVDEEVLLLQRSSSAKDKAVAGNWAVLSADLGKKFAAAQIDELNVLDGKGLAEALAIIDDMPNGGPLHAAFANGDDAHFLAVFRKVQASITDPAQLKQVLNKQALVSRVGEEILLSSDRTVFEALVDAKKYVQAGPLLTAGATAQIVDHPPIFERILDTEYARKNELGKSKKPVAEPENTAAATEIVSLMRSVLEQLDNEIDEKNPIPAAVADVDVDAILPADPQEQARRKVADAKAALRNDLLIMVATKAATNKNPAILQELLRQEQNYSAEAVKLAQKAIEQSFTVPQREALNAALNEKRVDQDGADQDLATPPAVEEPASEVTPKTLDQLVKVIIEALERRGVDKEDALVSEITNVVQPGEKEQFKTAINQVQELLAEKTPLQASVELGFYGLASALIAAEADVASPLVGANDDDTLADLLITKMAEDKNGHTTFLARNPKTFLGSAKRDVKIKENTDAYQAQYTKACELLKSLAAKNVALDGPLKAALDWAISKTDSAFFVGLLDLEGVQHSNSAAIAAAKAQIDVKVESLQNSSLAKDKAAVEDWVALSADLGRKFAAAQIVELNTLLAGKDSAAALAAVNDMPNGGPLHAALASGDIAHFTTVFEAVKASIKELVHLQEALNRKYKAGTASSNPERTVFEALVDARRYGQAQLLLEAGAVVGEEALGQILNAEYARRDELKAKKLVVTEDGSVGALELIATVFTNLNVTIVDEVAKGELRDWYLIQVVELAANYKNPDILSAVLGGGVQDYDKKVIDRVRALLVDMPKKDNWVKIDKALTDKIKPNVVDAAPTKDAPLDIHDLVTLWYKERKQTWQQENRLFGGAISFLVTEVPLDSTMKASIEATLANYSLAQKASFLELIVTKAAEYKDPYILRELLKDPEIYGDEPVATIESAQRAIEKMPTKGVWREVRELLGQKIAEKGVKLLSSVIDEVLVGPSADEGGPEVRDPMDPAETALVNPSLVVTADADPLDTNLPLLDTGHGPILTGDSPGDGLLTPPAVVDPSKTTGQLVPKLPKGKAPTPKVNSDPLEEEKMAEDYNKILEKKDTTESQIALLADFVSGVEKLYRITIGSDGTLRDEGNKQAWKGMWTDSKGNEYQTTKNGCLSSQEKEALRAFCPEKLADKVVGDSFDSANPDLDLAKNVSEHFTNPENLKLITAWVTSESNKFRDEAKAKADKPSTTLVNRAAKSLQEITASKNVKAAHQAR